MASLSLLDGTTTSFFTNSQVLNTKFSLLHNCGFCSGFLERCTSVPPSLVVQDFFFHFHYRFDLDLHFPIVNMLTYLLTS